MSNVYYNGELIPAEDWDYVTKKPKAKSTPKPKKETPKPVEVEVDLSFIDEIKLQQLED